MAVRLHSSSALLLTLSFRSPQTEKIHKVFRIRCTLTQLKYHSGGIRFDRYVFFGSVCSCPFPFLSFFHSTVSLSSHCLSRFVVRLLKVCGEESRTKKKVILRAKFLIFLFLSLFVLCVSLPTRIFHLLALL